MADDAHDGMAAYLEVLAAGEPAAWLEIRELGPTGYVDRRFVAARRAAAAAPDLRDAARTADVFVGVLPRARPRGTRAAIDRAGIAWADCDDAASTARAMTLPAPPSMVVASGSPGCVHAYWLLDRPLSAATVERANRRFADALGADPTSADATRLLRPPGTLNHKHDPPAAVTLIRLTDDRHRLVDLVGELPDPPAPPQRIPEASGHPASSDPLRRIPPAVYVERILGQTVPRSRKLTCPFHADRVPSLHVYDTPERGWFCFGCRRGGSIYDLAAAAWAMSTRGAAFLELRSRLYGHFAC
jgi:hypothetical protein